MSPASRLTVGGEPPGVRQAGYLDKDQKAEAKKDVKEGKKEEKKHEESISSMLEDAEASAAKQRQVRRVT